VSAVEHEVDLPELDKDGRARLTRLRKLAEEIGIEIVIAGQTAFLEWLESEHGASATSAPATDLVSDCLQHLRASAMAEG